MMIVQIVIIGSGPAGLSAAIYSARAGLKPVIVAPAMGGQLQGKGVGVENFPGVNESTGPNLVHLMQLQVRIEIIVNWLASAAISSF
jgi:thioredoxin reductase